MSAPSEQLVGTVLAGRYRLIRVLAEGGMGTVFEADDGGVAVAVKVVRPEAAEPEVIARFVREAALTKGLVHPHVVPVLDLGTAATGMPFLVMPLLAGIDLDRLLAQVSRVEPMLAVRIALQACAGLAAAHAVDVIHRDVKPSNLFLDTRPNGEIVVRVLDFGMGKRVHTQGDSLTESGRTMGSPIYMSPEQVQDSKHVDARTDVYSLGAVLYQLLTGAAPWGHLRSLSALLIAIMTQDPEPIADRVSSVDEALVGVVMRALQRDPEIRFGSAREFRDALSPFSGGNESITASMLGEAGSSLGDALGATTTDPAAATLLQVDRRQGDTQADMPAQRLVGTRLAGRFPVVRLLGQGGMGAVYEVLVPDGTSAAAKVLNADVTGDGDAGIRRFLREARAATAIDDPHVVRVLDLGTDEALGVPFILMELLRGTDLALLLRDEGPLEPLPALRVVVQAARGLSAAHRKGVIHRDVKPANLFLHAPEGDRITVKVCDFGIAKRTDADRSDQTSQELTRSGGVLGSPLYMSPEQATSAKTVDLRTDVWSLSATLFEALAGRRLWEGQTSLGEIIVAICTRPIPLLAEVAPWVDPGIAAVVERGLSRDPAERWPSVDAMIEALTPFTDPSEAVRFSDLVRVPPARREAAHAEVRRAMTAPPQARSGNDAGAGSLATSTVDGPPLRRPGWRTLAALGAGVAALAGAIALAGSRATGVLTAQSTAASATPEPARKIRLGISPPDADVVIAGRPVPVVEGAVQISGVPGDVLQVTLRRGDRQASFEVFMTKDGRVEPHRLELQPPPMPPTAAPEASGLRPADARAASSSPIPKPGPTAHGPPSSPPVAAPAPGAPPKPPGGPVLAPTEKW